MPKFSICRRRKLPYIIVNTHIRKLRFIIDTGAEFSIINPKLCRPQYAVQTSIQSLKVLGRNILTRKQFCFPLFKEFKKNNYFVNFIEYPFHNYFDGIIGNNILLDLNSIIDYKNRKLLTDDTTMPIYFNEGEEISLQDYMKNEVLQVLSCEQEIEANSVVEFAKHLNSKDEEVLRMVLNNYQDIFYKEGENLPFTTEIKHRIITKSDTPIYSRLYRYPVVHRAEVDRQIKEMLAQEIIVPSNSPYNSPLWVVPKKADKNGKPQWRVVIDYRKLNEQTIDDKFPIPNMHDIFDKLGKCCYFSTIDLAKGFHQIEVHPNDRAKTAFSTADGHYEFTRMPFGLKTAPATFQRLINYVLRDHINKICVVYLDDILIFSTSFDEHIISIKKIFNTLRASNLKIQLNKCQFADYTTKFLGHVVSREGIKPDPSKISSIEKMKPPTNIKEIKQFLGMTGYYRKFIRDYAKVAYPMVRLLKRNALLDFQNIDFLNSFNNLKKLITSEPVLQPPDFNKKFILTTDASQFAIGSVLSQNSHPICYASRTLSDHEIRYSTIEKEALALVWSVKHFRTYLYGRKFLIQTDHKPLIWLHNIKEPNMKLQRWKILLNEYDFEITYIKGKDNTVADTLSRYFDTNNDNIADKVIYNNIENSDNESKNAEYQNGMSVDATVHSALEDNLKYIFITERCINCYKNQIYLEYGQQEKYYLKIINKKCQTHITVTNKSDLKSILEKCLTNKGVICIYCENNELFIKFQYLYVNFFENSNIKLYRSNIKLNEITDKNEILTIIEKEHLRNNHRGIQEVYLELKTHYFYPKLFKLITYVVNNCSICQIAKFDRKPLKTPYQVTETPTHFNDIVHIDIWFPYRNTMYFTTIDKFSKYATFHRINDRNWIAILAAIKQRILFLGKMNKIVFDNDRCILHSAVRLFLKEQNIEMHTTTAYLKTGNSDVERLHGTLNEHLRLMEADKENKNLDLEEKLFKIFTCYNNTIHTTTKMRPIDFIIKNFDKESIEELSKLYEKQKIERIEKLNKNRDHEPKELLDNIVRNRQIPKNKPKYKKLVEYTRNGNYVIDDSNNRKTKYYKTQLKRRYNFQE